MEKDVMKLRDICVTYSFDIGGNETLEFTVFRRFEKNGRTEMEISLDEVENSLTYEQMLFMSQTIGEESCRLGKINQDRYDIQKRKLYDE